MATDAPERHYRAPCPGCGAPVEFRSAQSTYAICPFCQSTVVRSGDVLARVGKMAELFDDHSPLQLMASGRIQLEEKAQPFTLIGRAQYKSSNGVWTEWNAILEDGSMAALSEDNGAYVFTLPLTLQRPVPEAEHFRLGITTAINGKPYSVAFNEQVKLISAQGELPKLPPLGVPFSVVELRGADGDVISIDYSPSGTVPAVQSVARGRAVLLEDLKFQGLKEESAREEKGRQFTCPNCGNPVQVALDSTKTITCRSCNSIIDLSSGLGGELRHAEQNEPIKTLIPLGAKGQLQGVHWQVVGFQHRMGQEPGDDEQFGWDEYLLYNRKRGFSFLVDSSDGWSMVKPATGAPNMANRNAQTATYLGTTYTLEYSYDAETTYVAGEFYWPVSRGQKTFNRDFASANGLLSQEQTPNEVTWSVGSRISSDTVAKAFKLEDKAELLGRGDVKPFSAAPQVSLRAIIIGLVLLMLVLMIMNSCSGSRGGSSRSSGGSYGGFSSGGGHK
ncbi:MAG: DUF4178 domain-containing protein [Comamonadaceae bacterium]|nr:DUF4178 domain-containing protein [Comamonadaceae bacterium]